MNVLPNTTLYILLVCQSLPAVLISLKTSQALLDAEVSLRWLGIT